jgi:hypothetical protein
MASHTQATPIPSVDNEPHHHGGENFPAFLWERMDRYDVAANDHHHNDDLAIDETRPRSLGSPFRTLSPSSSRGSTSTKRSHDSMEDDDSSTLARPHQQRRHNSQASPPPPFQEDPDFHRERQAAPLAPVRQQPPGIEYAARNVLPFNGFLQQSGLDREEVLVGRGAQVAAPPDHHRLRRMTFDFAVPAPRDREHRRLPSPRPGPEHFAGEFAAAAAPPSPPPAAAAPENLFAPRPLPPALLHHVLLRPRSPPALFPPPPPPAPEQVPAIFDPEHPVDHYYQQAGYYHLGQRIFQPAPPPRRWLDWPDMSAGHREAWIAVEEWEDSARELIGRLDGMIERGWGWIEGVRG